MRHRIPRILLTLAVLTGLTLAGPLPSLWSANLSTDYTGVPPYISNVVTPNVLMLMDNSLSMRERANCDPVDCKPQSDGTSIDYGTGRFQYTKSYTGYFDSMRCYTYESSNQRFQSTSTKGLLGDACSDTEWDGNMLNWITFRRIDAVKNAMIGGECATARITTDGTCPPIGSPAKSTIKSHRSNQLLDFYLYLDPTDPNQVVGRVPAANRYTPLPFGVLIIHLRGTGGYVGWFCVDNDTDYIGPDDPCDAAQVFTGTVTGSVAAYTYSYSYPAGSYSYCDTYVEGICTSYTTVDYPASSGTIFVDAYSYSYDTFEMRPGADPTAAAFNIRMASDTQRTGVIQQIGNKARFGLMIFQPDTSKDGGKVLVGIGARQSLDFRDGSVTTFGTNSIAMIDGLELTEPATPTPLAESLYSAARYIAQLPPTFDTGFYTYPLAFGGAAPLGGTGVGSIGPGEITALGSTETCPSGYITGACGRDPYFFGQNFTPAWASPSAVVPCCKTFVIIVTDGAPTLDATIPVSLKNYAAAVYGTKCTGSDQTSSHMADGTCNGKANTPASTLLKEHKTDYPGEGHYLDDVALWAHTVDLRQTTIPGIPDVGHDLPGMQNITLYTVYAFGSINGREILMQAARQGGFEDKNGDGLPDLDGQECINADGSKGRSSPEWDQVNNLTGKKGPDCIPDNYFESSSADSIRDRLFLTISQILEKNTAGAAVSVLASSSTGEGISYQAFFYQTKTEIADSGVSNQLTWLGYLQGFFVDQFGNLREDTVGDGKLILKDDHIVKLRFEPSPFSGLPRTVADIFGDSMGSGVGDVPLGTVELSDLKAVWEGGRRLALTNPANRTILTWIDLNNNGLVDPGEQIPFTNASTAAICPYLGASNVSSCVSGGAGGAGQKEASDIINFIRGVQDPATGFRDRQRQVKDDADKLVPTVWKLGDIMASTPALVGIPHERYDVIYGDIAYSRFFRLYKDRRQVVYAGANDGMLHAFNGGFLSTGVASANERIRFTTTPLQPGSDVSCGSALPCDASASDPTYTLRTGTPPSLGAELWAFVPQDLLPQLRWLTDPNYSHIYYVDLKPKATDVRIFCDTTNASSSPNCIDGQTTSHPGGWGTILIGGFRFGGSCSNCNQGKGGARTVTADFGGGPSTRVFLSSYFVLDVTNPEKDPVLLWTFRDQDLGLTTAVPAVVRVNTVGGASNPNEKWYVVFGTGMTHYDGSSGQTAQVFVVDLLGPSYQAVNQTSGTVRGKACVVDSPCLAAKTTGASAVTLFSTAQTGFMGDAVSVDADLDFRVDVIYVGSVFCRGGTPSPCNGSSPVWKGAMWRLTTDGGSTRLNRWGVSGTPSKLISTFACADTTPTCSTVVGPIVAAPTVSIDNLNNFWVFFGTGRLIGNLDKGNTDTQNFFGVKDCIITNSCPSSPDGSFPDEMVERHDLFVALDLSKVSICVSCAPSMNVSTDGGATFIEGFDNLVTDVQTKDGWFITLTPGERGLSTAALLGKTLFFSTFIPDDSICEFSGNGRLYAVNYLTGTGSPISSLGTTTVGSNKIANTFIAIDPGMPSQVSLHIGSKNLIDPDNTGKSSTAGCTSGVTANVGTSTLSVSQPCVRPGVAWSRILAWRDL